MNLVVRQLGLSSYKPVWAAMKSFTASREPDTLDELWITEHHSVFTLGQAAKPEHLIDTGDIPVVQTDRGGQVTFHGPGQIVGYLLRDLRRRRESVHEFVRQLEATMISTLETYDIQAARLEGNPGVYVDGKKIGAIGLRIRRGCSYHGIALNISMDLQPFHRINPCGLVGMAVTQVAHFVPTVDWSEIVARTIASYQQHFEYDEIIVDNQDTPDFLSA